MREGGVREGGVREGGVGEGGRMKEEGGKSCQYMNYTTYTHTHTHTHTRTHTHKLNAPIPAERCLKIILFRNLATFLVSQHWEWLAMIFNTVDTIIGQSISTHQLSNIPRYINYPSLLLNAGFSLQAS